MKYLVFPFFITKLFFSLSFFILKVLFQTKKEFLRIFVFTIALILSLLTFLLTTFLEKESLKQIFLQKEKQRIENLKKQQQDLLQILQAQPTHKDTLINLSIIACKLEEFDKCTDYYNQAKKLDPNDPFFQSFSPYGDL